MASKAKIDKAGLAVAGKQDVSEYELLELEDIFDEYRKGHLEPLSQLTLELQQWLSQYEIKYYITQRLKRKPQIIRKLNRFHVRLTQLQDIGGCRIVVHSNSDVEQIVSYFKEQVEKQKEIKLIRITDYRQKGRDDSGYRAVHLIIERSDAKLELQIRSRIQHYWAESIERTSVIYGHYLKELEGDPLVVEYFKTLSDLFYEIESGIDPDTKQKLKIACLRDSAEKVIQESDRKKIFHGFVNEGIVKTLIEKEKTLGGPGLNNWIFVFDWNAGAFVSWDVVARDPDIAIKKYVEHERIFPAEAGFEVVLVGSSEVATVKETHSHYFGINAKTLALETFDESIMGFSSQMDLDTGARQILDCLHRKHYWGNKTVAPGTLKNHYCKNVLTFEASLQALIEKGLVHRPSALGGIALDIKLKREIEDYL